MKLLFVFLFAVALQPVTAQTVRTDIAKQASHPERKPLLDALRKKLQVEIGTPVTMVVTHLYTQKSFAFFTGEVRNSKGGDIDFKKTKYREALEGGAFDGPSTTALLKKTAKGWVVMDYAVGPTDVAWACWWKEYSAPKELFDYAEACTN